MKILFLCEGDAETRDSWSGVSKSVISHLRDAGHEVMAGDVDLYGLARLRVALRTLAWRRKRWWVRFHLSGAAFRARSRRARRSLRKLGKEADIIFQVGATFRVRPRDGTPLVLYCDSHIELSRTGARAGYSEAAELTTAEIDEIRRREADVYARADRIFTMSDMLRESFIMDFGLSPQRLVTVHCAPNVEFPEETLDTGHAAGRIARTEARTPTVLFVGRDFSRKGGDLLLSAFERVRSRVPDGRILIVGSEPPGTWPEWVHFTGYLDRDTPEGYAAMDRAYRDSTVFCLPTRFEPFGTSFVEAMGYALPCVGPRAWAIPEIIVDGETGFIVPPEDPAALADALLRLLLDRELAERMGREGRSRAVQHFTWPRIIDRMLGAMEPLVTVEGSPGDASTSTSSAA
jgi:alpha-maltose-1-phosphate synthase